MKYRMFINGGIGIGMMILFLLFGPNVLFPYTAVAVSDIPWKQAPPLLVFQNIEREGNTGLLFIRITDGKEQFLPGTWDVTHNRDVFYAFGKLPDTFAESNRTKIVYATNEQLHWIDGGPLSQTIRAVKENATRSHFFIEMESQEGRQYCIAERVFDGALSCKQLSINKPTRAFWNSNDAQSLILLTENGGTIYVYDVQEGSMRALDPRQQPEEYGMVAGLAQDSREDEWRTHDFFRLLNIIVFKQGPVWAWYHIPLRTQSVFLFRDMNHALVVERDRISVLTFSLRTSAPLITQPGIGRAMVYPNGQRFFAMPQ